MSRKLLFCKRKRNNRYYIDLLCHCELKKKVINKSFIFWLIVGILFYAVNNFFPFSPINQLSKKQGINSLNFVLTILDLIIFTCLFIKSIELVFYIILYILAWGPQVFRCDFLKKSFLPILYKKDFLVMDTIWVFLFWVYFSSCFLPNPLSYVDKKDNIHTITSLIIILVGAVVLWFFYTLRCIKNIKEKSRNNYLNNYHNVDITLICARIVRTVIVALVAWITVLFNFILGYPKTPANLRQTLEISSIINTVVTLYYPVIDIFIYVYDGTYNP